ncbi:uroporphyrinogen decarboxylase [Thermicanus aegyptius]|uniref:uroporphyrinogen decarboxylase n=1 Tax=Thermicanus aegyptius TaxID=94009 RepID=UPI00040A3DB9|nr:uroporphyrinogen decarboxylase [Thermicanus aegyptius]
MLKNDRFLRACRKEEVDQIPVWYMRQAGRFDPEYRKIKEKYTLLEISRNPELAAQITMMPVHKLGVDAAILYSDIMNPVESLGIEFHIVKEIGPVIPHPIRTLEDVKRMRPFDAEGDLPHILDTIHILHKELTVPLIGFAGAPFTIASYLIEGKPSRNYIRTKELMYGAKEVWEALMERLTEMVSSYLRAQILAGADAVQLFDSWVGALSPKDYTRYVLPYIRRIFISLEDLPQPKIYFPGVSSGEILPTLREIKADVIGLDWRVSIREGRRRTGGGFSIQGNLDPMLLTAPFPVIQEYAKEILDEGMEAPGYIFNLGHGLFPEADLDKVKALTEWVHHYSGERLKEGGAVRG